MNSFSIGRGIRQEDTISLKLFNWALEGILKTLDWPDVGVNINGERLTNLRFADDIVLFTDNEEDLQNI